MTTVIRESKGVRVITRGIQGLPGAGGGGGGAVDSVNGQTGAVVLVKADIGLGNVDNTSDVNKPVSTAQQTALNAKVPTTRTVNGKALSADISITASDVGLGNVTNVAQVPLSYLDADTTLAANSDTKVATQKAVKAYADNIIAAADALVYKGAVDCSTNPNYPAASAGWFYKVSVAGKIGGASGTNVEAGDSLLCILDGSASGNQATVGANWNIIQTNIDGAVIGAASSTDRAIAIFSGTGGKLIQNTGVTIDVSNNLTANNVSGINTGNETATTTGALINSATSKATPVDADFIGLMDSAASNILKKLSWANIKATLKTYFDTLYPSGSGTCSGTNTGDQSNISNATLANMPAKTFKGNAGASPAAPQDLTAAQLKAAAGGIYDNGNSGTSATVAFDNGTLQKITITGAVAIALTAPALPNRMTLLVTQNATGFAYSLPAGIIWVGGAPTLSSTANKKDSISLIWDGTTYWGMAGVNHT